MKGPRRNGFFSSRCFDPVPVRFLLFALVVLCALASCSRNSEVGLNPGDIAPDPQLSNLDDEPAKLSDHEASLVVLNFWTTWCAPCVEEMPDLERLYQRLKPEGGVVIAVAVKDDLSAVRRFVKEKKITFPVLFDRDGVSNQKFKISGFPESFILDPSRKLQVIPDFGSGSPVVKIVGPRAWASNEVVDQLLGLLNDFKKDQ